MRETAAGPASILTGIAAGQWRESTMGRESTTALRRDTRLARVVQTPATHTANGDAAARITQSRMASVSRTPGAEALAPDRASVEVDKCQHSSRMRLAQCGLTEPGRPGRRRSVAVCGTGNYCPPPRLGVRSGRSSSRSGSNAVQAEKYRCTSNRAWTSTEQNASGDRTECRLEGKLGGRSPASSKLAGKFGFVRSAGASGRRRS
jgi:hypothetical protein